MRVLICTGPSGGHIFPALSFLNGLKNKYKDLKLLLVLPYPYTKEQRLLIDNIINGQGLQDIEVKYSFISNIKWNFDFKNFLGLLRFIKGSWQSIFILLEFRPELVAGFGSLNSIPFVFLAWLFRINTLIHEQNVIPGQANRLLLKLADKIAISFEQTKDYLTVSPQKLVLTGNPLRLELKKIETKSALSFFGFEAEKITLLIAGGSQGSQGINLAFLKAISKVSSISNLQVIHISGSKDYDFLARAYKELRIKIKLFAFLAQMHYAYSLADLAICRAGATTMAELIEFRVPAIIIPYPYALRHQVANAKVLEEAGSAILIDDGELGSNRLGSLLEDLILTPDRLKVMRLGFEALPKSNARVLLTDLV